MDFHSVFRQIRKHSNCPCVSIILHNPSPTIPNRVLQGRLKNAVKEVDHQLQRWHSESEKVKSIRVHLQQLLDSHIWDTYAPSLAIFINQDIQEITYLPFPVQAKVIVDTSFEVRDILYTMNRLFHHYVLSIGWKNTRMWEGFGKYIFPKDIDGAPDGAEAYREPLNEIRLMSDRSQYEATLMKKYIRDLIHYIDKKGYITHAIPWLIAGDPKFVHLFKETFPYPELIVGEMPNTLDHASISEVQQLVEQRLTQMTETYESHLFQGLQKYIDAQRYVSGLEAAWRVIHQGRGMILVVERGYRTEGWSAKNRPEVISLQPMKAPDYLYHEDAVDDLIEACLDRKGRVYFASSKWMKPYRHILTITRY